MAIWRRRRTDTEASADAVDPVGDGAHAVQLVSDDAPHEGTYAVHLAPDDRALAVVRDGVMTLYGLDRDRLVPLDLPPGRITGHQPISWSASGEWLAYIDENERLQLICWATLQSRTLRSGRVTAVALGADGSLRATVDADVPDVLSLRRNGTLRVVELASGRTEPDGHVPRLAFSPDGRRLAVGRPSGTTTVVFDTSTWDLVAEVAIHGLYFVWLDNTTLASSARDGTVRFWSLPDGRERRVLEIGETVLGLHSAPHHHALFVWTPSRLLAYSTADWHVIDQESIAARVHDGFQPVAASARSDLLVKLTGPELTDVVVSRGPLAPNDRRPTPVSTYANAKILLLGDSGVGKSGLALVLAGKDFEPTASTHARHVWRMRVPELEDGDAAQREVLLWDLAGQPGYRVVHQLHLSRADAALVLFDSRSETTPLAGIGYWARALRNAQAAHGPGAEPIPTFLVAARIDRGVVGVSDERLANLADEFGFRAVHSTSALDGTGVVALREAALDAIDWSRIPVVTSSVLFAAVKSFVLDQKAAGSLLTPLSALHAAFLTAPVTGPATEAAPEAQVGGDLIDGEPNSTDLRGVFEGCVARLESAGLVKQLAFGDLVLLQPELLDVYAGAIVNAARAEPDGLGTVLETYVHDVRFPVPEKDRIADGREERLLVIATVEELLRHEVVLREETEAGTALVFPSAFRRDLPGGEEPSGARIEFHFDGPVATIYATLVVRLSRTERFSRRDLWQSAARFEADVGGLCSVHLTHAAEGRGVLQLAFDDAMAPIVRRQCEQFVGAHLDRRATAGTVRRERLHSCPDCGAPFSREQIRAARSRGRSSVLCPVDETRVSLDEPGPCAADDAARVMNASADAARTAAAATSVLRGKEETGDFDVFLCHNVVDKPAVRELAARLRGRGLLPWLDEAELPPGRPWQPELERRIDDIGAAVVLIGPDGIGPWQSQEITAFLREFVERGSPVIPVLLPGGVQPALPVFLRAMTWIDLTTNDALDRLEWGITGTKPWLIR